MTGSDDFAAPRSTSPRAVLSVMMFLEIFIWGAWFPVIFGYLRDMGYSASEQPWILGTFNLAALVALFFSTQFADRNFAAEKFMAFSHVVGGLALLGLFFVRKPAGDVAAPFWPFFLLMLVYSLFYVPTISISNAIAFAHLKDPQREFGLVRLWGTIGWIAAAMPFVFVRTDWDQVPAFGSVPFIDWNDARSGWLGAALGTPKPKGSAALLEATSYAFVVAGVASLLLAAFSLALPHTPPRKGRESLAWLEAARSLRRPFLLVLFLVTFLDAAVHQGYFFWTEDFLKGPVGVPDNWAPQVMTISQVAEILTMAFLGYVLKRLGWRTTMVIGVLGHAARFAIFAYFPYPWLAVTINVLHGICYAFFFATVYIFVDEFFPKDIRSSAQGLFNFLILGLGPFVANFVCARLGTEFKQPDGSFDFRSIFLVLCGAALVGTITLFLFFHPPQKAAVPEEVPLMDV
jgi:nucleoside transporter